MPDPDLGYLLTHGPSGAPAAGQRAPIGVPTGYFVERPSDPVRAEGHGWFDPGPKQVKPTYLSGDDLIPASYSPEAIAAIQSRLAQAGLISTTAKFRVGVWDTTSQNAYRTLLTYANRWGVDQQGALQRLAESPAMSMRDQARQANGGTTTSTNKSFSYTDPASATELLARTWEDQYGMRPTGDQLQQFVAQLHSAESASPTVTTSTTDGAGNTTSTSTQSNADPTALASQYAQTADPANRGAYQALNYYRAAMQLIGG